MPRGVYERTEEMKKKISEGVKEARKEIKERKKLTKEEKEQERQKVIKVRERDVLKAIKDILDYMANQGRLMYIRIQAGGYPTADGSFIKMAKAGAPDILVFKKASEGNGNKRLYYMRTIALEAKATRGHQSEEQKEWQQKFEELGGEYYVIRSVDEVLRILSYLKG